MKPSHPNLISLIALHAAGDWGPYTLFTSKRHQIINYPKDTKRKEPSPRQIANRIKWSVAASAWVRLPPALRTRWGAAATQLRLHPSGYNLWIAWHTTRDDDAIRTIEARTGLELIPDGITV